MSLVGDLLEAEWTARRRAYVLLALLLGATVATFGLVLATVDGLESGLGSELSDTLGADVRLTRGRTGLGDGQVMLDLDDVMAGLRFEAPDAAFAPRLETQAILLRGADFTNVRDEDVVERSAAVLVGIDPVADARVAPMPSYVTQGHWLPSGSFDLRTPQGERLVPIVVGEAFLKASNSTVYDGTFNWSAVYNVTAGRIENGELVRSKALVVGTYATGFRMIDRLVVYVPRGAAASLLGYFATDPPANVILAAAPDPRVLLAAADARGLSALDADAFRESYLGPVFTAVRASAWTVVMVLSAMTAVWVARTLSHHVHADRRKIATLRALGIPTAAFGRVYAGVGALLGLAGGVLGVVASMLLVLGLRVGLPLVGVEVPGPQPSLLASVLLVALATLTALAASGWAVAHVRRAPIREALERPQ